MEKVKKTVRTNRGQKDYTYLGCPLTRNRSAWCFRLCGPDAEGHGRCGRVAPHGLRGNTAASIESFNAKQQESHFEKLEHLYLTAPSSEHYDPGIKIAEGEAEIIIPVQDKFLQAGATVHSSLCHAAMNDAALLAVNSVVEEVLVRTASFHIYMEGPARAGELVARGRFLGVSGGHYLAEAVLTDADGAELGRGNGDFLLSDTPLSAEIGYE